MTTHRITIFNDRNEVIGEASFNGPEIVDDSSAKKAEKKAYQTMVRFAKKAHIRPQFCSWEWQ